MKGAGVNTCLTFRCVVPLLLFQNGAFRLWVLTFQAKVRQLAPRPTDEIGRTQRSMIDRS